jgi:outer membrane protein TolC
MLGIKFSPILFARLYFKGLQNNLDIRIAMQNIVAAQATMKQGKAGYSSLSVGTDWTHVV